MENVKIENESVEETATVIDEKPGIGDKFKEIGNWIKEHKTVLIAGTVTVVGIVGAAFAYGKYSEANSEFQLDLGDGDQPKLDGEISNEWIDENGGHHTTFTDTENSEVPTNVEVIETPVGAEK